MNAKSGSRWRLRVITRWAVKRLIILLLVAAGTLFWLHFTMIRMPGTSYRGPLPALTESQASLADELHRDVDMLAGRIGRRNLLFTDGLELAASFIERSLVDAGCTSQRQTFQVHGAECSNIEVEITGSHRPREIVVVGAHYDSVGSCPAANDNGSGVAATLALARMFAGTARPRTIRFVLFVNEEPPYFQTADMGSLVYANRCRQRGENIVAMLSLETIGYYSDAPGSQKYPPPFGLLYPDTGDFIAFVGNCASRRLVRRAIGAFRAHARFPSEGAAVPGWIAGVGWSDHWSFWQAGYPAIMITDTAPFRYPQYHAGDDTPDKLDFQRMARVVEGLKPVIEDLCGGR